MRTIILRTAVLLCCSNIFMTFAWYGHLRNLANRPWFIAAVASWGIAFFEYMLQVPANRIGHHALNVGQLKILQEVITLTIFVPWGRLSSVALAITVGGGLIFGSGLAYIAYYDALQALPASQLGAFLNIEPLVTTLMAAAMIGEAITAITLFGGAIILLGVYLVNRRQP